MAKHNTLGKKGEEKALEFLIANGYSIIEKNYRYLKAEIDIIAQKDDILAVVEVKTRSTRDFGLPQDFVSKKKIKLMVTAIDHYLNEREWDIEVRFDIIAVIKNKKGWEIEHLKDAFYHF